MNQKIEIRVEKSHIVDAILLMVLWCVGLLVTVWIGEISEVLCMGVAFFLWIIIESVPASWNRPKYVVAIFGEKELILEYAKKRKVIPYADIKEVGKEMVLTQYASEKGNYKVKIKTKKQSYRFLTPADEYEKHLDFEDTKLAEFYYEFRRHGVKCC